VGIEELLGRAPRAYRDVARIGSAIRHEVLKHSTTVLPSVADALDELDVEPARWAAERLYGARGAVARFAAYVEELQFLGRTHGVRLNLRHRDPVFGPLIAAMDRLSQLEADMRRGSGPKLSASLRSISQALNGSGYRGLGHLLRRVCVLELDEAVLRMAWDDVCKELGEPARGLALDVEIPQEPVLLRVFRDDLDDILVNLLRNAAEATLQAGSADIGVAVELTADPVAFLESAEIAVCDSSPRKLSTAMIRGRYIGRGLGLAVDLVSRCAGSVSVRPRAGWSKAVVVSLPTVEELDEALEQT
jgi:signal transduction histidine kinase